MKVVLIRDVANLGKANAVVEVRDGYAKNFLFKNNLAVPYTDATKKQLQTRLDAIAQKHDIDLTQAIVLKNQLDQLTLEFELQLNNQQKAFGSINNKQILDELQSRQILLDKAMLPENLKLNIGNHEVKVRIFETVVATLKVIVKGTN